jgi:hypothetical protein
MVSVNVGLHVQIRCIQLLEKSVVGVRQESRK